jgi:hypothetical protein
MNPFMHEGYAARALRCVAMAATIAGIGWTVFALTLPDTRSRKPVGGVPAATREAGYEIHRRLADSVPGLQLRIAEGRGLLLLPLDALERDETIEAWYSAMAASAAAVPGLRIEAQLPLDLDPADRARAMSLIATPALGAGLPTEDITFTDERPPRPPADDRGVWIELELPRAD